MFKAASSIRIAIARSQEILLIYVNQFETPATITPDERFEFRAFREGFRLLRVNLTDGRC